MTFLPTDHRGDRCRSLGPRSCVQRKGRARLPPASDGSRSRLNQIQVLVPGLLISVSFTPSGLEKGVNENVRGLKKKDAVSGLGRVLTENAPVPPGS